MAKWTFITNHGLILSYIVEHPQATIRDTAQAVYITERGVSKIIAQLESDGYITRGKKGRRSVYSINLSHPLRHDLVNRVQIIDLLRTLCYKQEEEKAMDSVMTGKS
ncbi:MAG: winged helix-turn-helix domain-containing protein [Chloroflexota bacterium]